MIFILVYPLNLLQLKGFSITHWYAFRFRFISFFFLHTQNISTLDFQCGSMDVCLCVGGLGFVCSECCERKLVCRWLPWNTFFNSCEILRVVYHSKRQLLRIPGIWASICLSTFTLKTVCGCTSVSMGECLKMFVVISMWHVWFDFKITLYQHDIDRICYCICGMFAPSERVGRGDTCQKRVFRLLTLGVGVGWFVICFQMPLYWHFPHNRRNSGTNLFDIVMKFC